MAGERRGGVMTLWYLARAAGLVALIAFTASTVLGALASSRSRPRSWAAIDRRFLTQMAHRSAAITGLLALLAHVGILVIDSYVDVSVTGAVVPFTAGFAPFALGLGTLATYAIVLAAVAGAARGRLAASARAARTWRTVHVAAYLGWTLSMGHGLLAGTDTGAMWSTAVYATCGIAVAVAVVIRLIGLDRAANQPLATARRLTRSAS
ncbi:ferric reductase [Aeromicrobium sp. Sec7.5]|uniref:ferric reductase n=1 Tax=Aeromicrobium sp. Sec7.5 TaxID=3121276 RepID=UPI002FE43622